MGEIEHAGTSKTMPAINSEATGGAVAGEIHVEPTIKTETAPGGDVDGHSDKVANQRGMPPISRP